MITDREWHLNLLTAYTKELEHQEREYERANTRLKETISDALKAGASDEEIRKAIGDKNYGRFIGGWD